MSKKKTRDDFIKDAHRVHGDNGDLFDKVNYINNKTKVIITCPKHGDFEMTPNSYLNGQICPKCAREKVAEDAKLKLSDFNRRILDVHGDKYDTSNVVYVNALTKVDIICKEHGVFRMTPAHLFEGHGCPECAKESRKQKKSNTNEEFVAMARKIHGDKYQYHNDYVNNKTKIRITCPKHGDFYQRPDDHLIGKGCPRCGHIISKAEDEIYELLSSKIGVENIIRHDTEVLDGLEIDIYIPQVGIGIEYNGLRWHSEEFGKDKNYHLNKTNTAESKGIHLIQIFEDEWNEHKDLVLEKLCHYIHQSNAKVIGARKCAIKNISKQTASVFLEEYHIQGFVNSTEYLGAYCDGMLLGVMSFLQESDGMWNLTRFSTNINYSIPGLANKMFKHFLTKHGNDITEVKTFLDRRWSNCNINVYDRMGFSLVEVEKPDYRYVVGCERKHKFGFRKNILSKKYGLPLTMTEYEMAKKLGFSRIWDCGLFKYVWKNNIGGN